MNWTRLSRMALITLLGLCLLSAGLITADRPSPIGTSSVLACTVPCTVCNSNWNSCRRLADSRAESGFRDCESSHPEGSPELLECLFAVQARLDNEIVNCSRVHADCWSTCQF